MSLTNRMPWFKLYSGVLEKPKVYQLDDASFRLWVELLCLANESSEQGHVFMDPDELALHLRRDPRVVAIGIGILSTRGLVEIVTSPPVTGVTYRGNMAYHLVLPDWHEKQNTGSTSAERMRRKRLKDKVNAASHGDGSGDVTGDALEREKKEKEKRPIAQPYGFAEFWAAYPKKKSKGTALKAWAKVMPSQVVMFDIMEAIKKQRVSPEWLKDGGQFIPYPASWLNARGWEDEVGVTEPRMSDHFKGAIG